jgi:hypothetical protein
MGSVIMGLDMLHVGRFSDTLHLVDLSDIVVEVWVVTDTCLVGLEIDNIDLNIFDIQEERRTRTRTRTRRILNHKCQQRQRRGEKKKRRAPHRIERGSQTLEHRLL